MKQTVEKVTVVRCSGCTDRVSFTLEPAAPSPFPEMEALEPGNYRATLSLEVRRGYAEEWLSAAFGLGPGDYEVIGY